MSQPTLQQQEAINAAGGVLLSAGAYGSVMASNYNSRPLVAEVMVHGRQAALVRERQPVVDIWAGESVAPWLK